MKNRILAIIVVVILLAIGFWYFTQDKIEQTVVLDEYNLPYPFDFCSVMFNLQTFDGRNYYPVFADVDIIHPDEQTESIFSSGSQFTDDFCGDDWTLKFTPVDIRDGNNNIIRSVDGETYTWSGMIAKGNMIRLVLTFSWE